FTYHNDNSRTGANTQEYALTTANVTTSTFGKLFSCTVDAAIYAQPLWVANVSVSGVNHNVVYVATQHNSVYAFDADSSACANVSFDAQIANERPALLLSNDSSGKHIIISWASHCDNGQYHGWVMSYGAATLLQEAVFNVSPNGMLGGVWMSGSGPAADASGNIFFSTGNGSWTGTDAFGDSIVKLGPPSAGQFGALDYSTPTNQLDLNSVDRDLGSGGVLLLPNLSSGAHT